MAKKVALLVGGWSAERQVSLTKGKYVEKALLDAGYEVDIIDVKQDLDVLIHALNPKPDVVFNNLHGRGGEDGVIQGVLETLEIPYTHSGVKASAIGMDKPLSKLIAKAVGVQCPESIVLCKEDIATQKEIAAPYVIKPSNEGSSVGIRIIHDRENQPPVDQDAWPEGTPLMVEQYIPGKELTVAVLDGNAQGVTEIIPQTRFFDYEAKYHDTRTELVFPAKIPAEVYETAKKWSETLYNTIGCHGLSRCDFRYDDSQTGVDGLYFLEINTQPGLTADSIGPSQVVHNGMSFPELCAHLVETAKCHNQNENSQTDEAPISAPTVLSASAKS